MTDTQAIAYAIAVFVIWLGIIVAAVIRDLRNDRTDHIR